MTWYELHDTDTMQVATDAVRHADRVLCFGVGKSAIVADLAASLLRSVSVPAVAVHATDVMHGDLNYLPPAMSTKLSVAIGFSHSGSTPEVAEALHVASVTGAFTISVSSKISGAVSHYASKPLRYTLLEGDGSKHGTIPTASVSAQLDYVNRIVCAIADEMSPYQLLVGHQSGALSDEYKRMTR